MSTPTSLHTCCHLEAEKTKLTSICDPLIPIIRYTCYKYTEERNGVTRTLQYFPTKWLTMIPWENLNNTLLKNYALIVINRSNISLAHL